jgi:hypothetical protein
MEFAGINYLAVFAAGLAGWALGAGWYMLLAKPWIAAHGWGSETEMLGPDGRASRTPFILSLIAEFIMAWVLAGVIGHLGPGEVTIRNGVISAASVWLGFVATTITVNYAFGRARPMLTVIDAGHWLAVLLLMGAIIGAFGV